MPKRSLASPFADALEELGIAFENRTARAPDDATECRLAHALARLIEEPGDSAAAATAIVLNCAPTTRRKRAAEMIELAATRSERVASLLANGHSPPGPLGRAISAVRTALEELRGADDLTEALAEMTGCEAAGEEADEGGADLDLDDSDALAVGAVTIMTVHSCKGLQADAVILPAVEPGSYEMDLVGQQKDERRRLLYVGITRALHRTYVTFSRRRYGPARYGDPTGRSVRKGPSEFIDDICDRLGIQPRAAGDYLRELLRS